MLRDPDTLVVVNCITSLNEILRDKGGMAVNRAIAIYLINRIREFNEWGCCVVLDLISSAYRPQTPKETYDFLVSINLDRSTSQIFYNAIDYHLEHINSGVVLSTAKLFLRLTEHNPNLYKEVLRRLRVPLLSCLSRANPPTSYCILQHIRLLISRDKLLFESDFTEFFCKLVYYSILTTDLYQNTGSFISQIPED
jgi:AP-4 complex subunit beta-1